MSIEDITGEVPGVEPGSSGPEELSQSALDRIVRRRQERSDILEIDIPSWDGDLIACYQVLGRQDLERMIRTIRARARDQKGTATGGDADLDFLIKACVEVKGYDQESDQKFHISDGYDMDLAGKITLYDEFENEIEVKNPRQLVACMLGKKDSSIALAAHSVKVARWMQDTSKNPIEDPQ